MATIATGQQPPSHLPSGAEPGQQAGAAVLAAAPATYDAQWVAGAIKAARRHGDATRGAAIFGQPQSACVSCHRVGGHGGTVGPELTAIARERDLQKLVTAIYWPRHEVDPNFVVWKVVTQDGRVLNGYRRATSDKHIEIRDLATNATVSIAKENVDEEIAGTTPMPEGLTASMSQQQQLDLIRFISELRFESDKLPSEWDAILDQQPSHQPVTFPLRPEPLVSHEWPHSNHPVNRHRIYEYYTKQAEYFRKHYLQQQRPLPMLLPSFPGLDGGQFGHWGYQPAGVWTDDRWNATELGVLQAGVFFGGGAPIPRAVCIRLGDHGELSTCFNPDTLTYEAVWKGGFVQFSSARHGFLDGVRPVGQLLAHSSTARPQEPSTYLGYYRFGKRVVFSYRLGDTEYLDAPWVKDGKFFREVAPAERHSLRVVKSGGPPQWPQTTATAITPGEGQPYAIDTIELPWDNPWNALLFCGGHDFLSDGSAVVCTIQGDVWRVTGLDSPPDQPGVAHWRRIAAGLHHALGVVVDNDSIYVQCRDQLARLHDLNNDGETDFVECYSNAFETSPAGHDFICGLEQDATGNFYFCSGNQGLVRISPDGKHARVLATGLRNSDGLAVLPDGTVTVPCSEGEWTPASMICAVDQGLIPRVDSDDAAQPPHFGYLGPRDGEPPELPLVYLPRGLDNSSGGQVFVDSESWGPLGGQLLHLSFGMGTHFLVLRDKVAEQWQGAIVPLAGDFRSGVHRGRFRPHDGQLYVTGMHGWVSFTPDDGCFQRVRYTGDPVQLPIGFHLHENGVQVTFSLPLDEAIAQQTASHFAQAWNYRYSSAYGSPEFSPSHAGVPGHDPLRIASTHVLPDGRTLFLEIPDLQPVSQLQLRLHVNSNEGLASRGHTLLITAHRLDAPFEQFAGYVPRVKQVAAHPLLSDLAANEVRDPNPWMKPRPNARGIQIETGQNLTFAVRELHARPGELLRFTLSNPDVVPHNWALLRPGTLKQVGELANRMIADPEAVVRQYIPRTDDVLVYTDVVPPGGEFTIHFKAPEEPGRYPYLCTFPGHWMVMNGVLIVE